MDLQAAELSSGRRWSPTKLAAAACFALACAFLIGSLLMPAGQARDALSNHPLKWAPSETLASPDH
ncbi:MAG TPA: hypothetical protein VNK52_15380 [Hyphomicrobiaceae bacterium]|nr:hypothetical protein [Hyphomicrobiaceae bacterium]